MQPCSDVLSCLTHMSLPREMHLCRPSSNVPRLLSFLNMYKAFTFCSLWARCRILCTCHENDASTFKSGPHVFFYTSTSKCAWRDVCSILIFKCASCHMQPRARFQHLNFKVCFSPQLNFQTRSENEAFFFYNLTSKCASRRSRVQFLIPHPRRWPRTRCFREPIFRPSGATRHWKKAVFRDFSTFSGMLIFFLLSLL